MFVTLVVGVLNRRDGRFRFVVAGHNPVILGDSAGNYRFLPSPAGILAGVDETAVYQAATLKLNKGEALLLYTDGVTEAMNAGHELFTEGRLLDCLAGAGSGSAAELAGRISRAVARFVDGAPASDDLTLLILRYQGG
jgi:sigma-B regulation protein RsbU (phosphoserine phosphatase)